MVKNPPAVQEIQFLSPSQENPLKEDMAIHSSIFAWRIPWTEEPGRSESEPVHAESDMTEQLTLSLWVSLVAQLVKNLPAMQETQETLVQSLGQEDPLEEGMTTYSSILAWRIPWTEEPGGLQSTWLQRVRHD